MCRLSLAWVTSENSTSNSNADILRLNLLRWTLYCLPLVSGVRCWLPLSVFPRQLSAARLSAVQRQLLSSGSPINSSQLLSPANSHSCPLTTSGYGEISCPRILCLVSRQNRQRNRLLWRPTHIVLQFVDEIKSFEKFTKYFAYRELVTRIAPPLSRLGSRI